MSEPTPASKAWSSWVEVLTGIFARRVFVHGMPSFPSQNYNASSNESAGTNSGDVLSNSPDVSGFSVFSFENRSSGSVAVFVTKNGTFNASQPAHKVEITDALTGDTVTALAIPANKTGTFRAKIKNFQLKQSGATGVAAGSVISSWGNF